MSEHVQLEFRKVSIPEECPFKDSPIGDCSTCIQYSGRFSMKEDQSLVQYDTSLCLREVDYRERLEQSGLKGIELRHTFENADLDKWNEAVFTFLQHWDWHAKLGIYIAAGRSSTNRLGNGTGKSYALHALAHKLCRDRVKCLYARTVDFLQQLKECYDGKSECTETEVLNRYTKVPVLLLDDIGKENMRTEWVAERFYFLIDTRICLEHPTIYASNFSLSELEERFGLDNFGPAIASRIAGSCVLFTLGGPDRRLRVHEAL